MNRKQRESEPPSVCFNCKELICRRNKCLRWLYANEDGDDEFSGGSTKKETGQGGSKT